MRFTTIFVVIAAGAMAMVNAIPVPDTNTPSNDTPSNNTPSNNTPSTNTPSTNNPSTNNPSATDNQGSTTNIQKVFTTLGDTCDPIIQKFDSCTGDDCTTDIVSELLAAINDSKNNLGSFTGGAGDSDLANVVSSFVTKIANGLEDHKNKCGSGCPDILTAFGQVDDSLSDYLTTCFNLYTSLAGLITSLLSGLVSTLKDVALTKVLSVCLLS